MNNDWGAIKGIFERHGHNVAKARKTNGENASPLRNFHKPVEQLRQQRREASQKVQTDNFIHHRNRTEAELLSRADKGLGFSTSSHEGHAKLVAALKKGYQPSRSKASRSNDGIDVDDSGAKVVLKDTLHKAFEPNRKQGTNLDKAA